MMQYRLTTVDNPYDPFTEYDDWYNFDSRMGYHTPSFLARIVQNSTELSDTDQELAVLYAIDEIVFENVLGLYRKVSRETSVEPVDQVSNSGN